jgi:selenide,water dikinase
LDSVLAKLPKQTDPNVLIGFDTADDAGVYRLSDELALVQTVDFFTPIVDDPYTFGQIAAANALSDVYAMGGRPISALSIVGFPNTGRDLVVLESILQGGHAKMEEAGCAVIGGHSIGDEEIKFGYAVTGLVNPARVLSNAGALPGDRLILTKRIGTGIISTALKQGCASEAAINAAIESMCMLNRNREFLEGCVEFADCVLEEVRNLLFDPQTSGGLLLAAEEQAAASLVTALRARSIPTQEVGEVIERTHPLIQVR